MFDRVSLVKIMTVVALMPLLASCYFLKSTGAPIPYQAFLDEQKQNDHLMVFLPGLGDEPSAFSQAGFFGSDIFTQVPFDYLLVDSHLGYYTSRAISERMKQDILDPMSKRYKKITLVGTSLGGFGALLLAEDYPEIIYQAILIAPYMGNPEAIDVVKKAGGLERWYQQGAEFSSEMDDLEQTLMAWRRAYRLIYEHNSKIILTYGEQDGFALSGEVLAKNLPSDRVVTLKGGHKWVVWKQLWKKIIQQELASI